VGEIEFPTPPGSPPEIAVLFATAQHSSGDMVLRVADEIALRNVANDAFALRICCGCKRNTHCFDSDQNTAPVADVAANIMVAGYSGVPMPYPAHIHDSSGVQSVAPRIALTSACSNMNSLSL
jgi:hypothetical protein